MNLKNLCFLLFLSFSSVVQAQMVDLLSSMAIQGQLTAQSAGQLKIGFSMIKQNDLINKLNFIIMDAQLKNNKETIQKSQFNYNLEPLDWDIKPVNSQQFYILLKNIDRQFCSKLINSFSYKEVYINNIKTKECTDANILKIIF